MSGSRLRRFVTGLALSLGLLFLPAAQAAPAAWGDRDAALESFQPGDFVHKLLRPVATLFGLFERDTAPPGQKPGNDDPAKKTREGHGIDPFGGNNPGRG